LRHEGLVFSLARRFYKRLESTVRVVALWLLTGTATAKDVVIVTSFPKELFES